MKKFFLLSMSLFAAIFAFAQSSPYTGVAIADIQDGTSYYLYNVDFGKWLGDNNRNTAYGWTSHSELVDHGRDIKFIARDGGWQLDPKEGNNHSINGSGLYMDTNQGVTTWTIEALDNGTSNAVKIKAGGTGLATNDNGDMDENADGGEKHNNWQIVSREERLQYAIQNGTVDAPVNISGLVLGGTFPVACDHRGNGTWQGDKGSNASGGDGFYHCNRVWELWGISNRDVYQDIQVPNGKYLVKARAIYVSTANNGQNADRYNEYVADPTGNTKGVIYANEVSSPMHNVYEYASDERVNDRFTLDLGNGKWSMNGTNEFSTNMFEGKGEIEPIEVTVTTGSIRVGFKVEGANNAWMLINNIDLYCMGEVVDITPYLEALNAAITDAEAFNGVTTNALQGALNEALAAAKALTESTDKDAISNASGALVNALNAAKAANCKDLVPTVLLAQNEGCNVSEIVDYLTNGTDNQVDKYLRLARNLRKLNAASKVDVSKVHGSEPDNGEFYILNVGTGLFLDITADWSTHVSIDNPGLLFTLEKGNQEGIDNRQVFFLHGAGFNGFNWSEEYFDKNGEHKFHFVPVEGKENVYYINVFDNYDWHFIYDVNEDVCDGNTHYWNAVQKRNNNTYKSDLNAQWMFVSAAERLALLEQATEDAPVEATFLINNPNFTYTAAGEGANITRGWENPGGVCSADRRAWYVLEWFERDVDMKQTITGLPKGKYVVGVNGFFRDGAPADERVKVENGEDLKQLAYLYGATADAKSSYALPNVTDELGRMPGVGDEMTVEGVKYEGAFANWPWQAQEYFQTGLYACYTDPIEVGEDGTLTIGIEMQNDGTPMNWVVADNFRLYYLGEAVEPFEVPAPTVTLNDAQDAFVFTFTGIDVPNADEPTLDLGLVTFTDSEGLPYYAAGFGETDIVNGTVVVTVPFESIKQADLTTGQGTWESYSPKSETIDFVLQVSVYNNHADGTWETLADEVEVETTGEFIVTGIKGLGVDGEKVIYNIAGQKMKNTIKGVNIINGKKSVIK